MPWDLDEALRRRLEKRIYIALPEVEARAEMLRLNLREVRRSKLASACSVAAFALHLFLPITDSRTRTRTLARSPYPCPSVFLKIPVERGVSIEELAARTDRFSGADIHLLCREASMMPMRRLLVGKTPDDILRMRSEGLLRAPAVTMADFNAAVLRTNPSVSDGDINRFIRWETEFGST